MIANSPYMELINVFTWLQVIRKRLLFIFPWNSWYITYIQWYSMLGDFSLGPTEHVCKFCCLSPNLVF